MSTIHLMLPSERHRRRHQPDARPEGALPEPRPGVLAAAPTEVPVERRDLVPAGRDRLRARPGSRTAGTARTPRHRQVPRQAIKNPNDPSRVTVPMSTPVISRTADHPARSVRPERHRHHFNGRGSPRRRQDRESTLRTGPGPGRLGGAGIPAPAPSAQALARPQASPAYRRPPVPRSCGRPASSRDHRALGAL